MFTLIGSILTLSRLKLYEPVSRLDRQKRLSIVVSAVTLWFLMLHVSQAVLGQSEYSDNNARAARFTCAAFTYVAILYVPQADCAAGLSYTSQVLRR